MGLYNELSSVYEAMYQTFIDYDEEYDYYSKIAKRNNSASILEVGCGTGHLASLFIKNNFRYTGIDISQDMLNIAKQKNLDANFINADARLFKLVNKVDAALITGRTISYFITNEDVCNAFKSIRSNLNPPGILVFDCIDASKFIPMIKEGFDIRHDASLDGKNYYRESHWQINFAQSWAFDWHSKYYETVENTSEFIGQDDSTIRAFTKEEITLMLDICGFETVEIYDRLSYAFDTFVTVAKICC